MNIVEHTRPDTGSDAILVVDDEPMIRKPLAQFLNLQGFTCNTAGSGEQALEVLESNPFSLMICDIRMPGLNGLELLHKVRQQYPDLAIIMITAVSDLQTAVQAMKQGANDYITKPFDLDQVVRSVESALEERVHNLEDRSIAKTLQGQLQKKSFALHSALRDLEDHRDMTLEALVRALDAREHETGCHSLRVQAYAVRLGQEMGFTSAEILELARGALLHDIGKIGVPDSILLKPGPLTDEEWVEMKKHPTIGYQILNGIQFLENSSKLVLHHHERFDGGGYPKNLKSNNIPLHARIFTVIDAYDAMTTDRPYRKALSTDYARTELTDKSGCQFDPIIARKFLDIPQRELDQIRTDHL